MMLDAKRKFPPCTPYKPLPELNFSKVIVNNLKYNNTTCSYSNCSSPLASESATPSNGAHTRKKKSFRPLDITIDDDEERQVEHYHLSMR